MILLQKKDRLKKDVIQSAHLKSNYQGNYTNKKRKWMDKDMNTGSSGTFQHIEQ